MVSAYRPLENTYDLFATIWGNLRSNTKDEAAKDWTASIAKTAKLMSHLAFISVNILVDATAIRSIAAVCLNTGSSERYNKLFQMAVGSRVFLCVASMAYAGYQLGKDKKFSLFPKISPEIQLKGEINLLKEHAYELCETIERRINDFEDDVQFGTASKDELNNIKRDLGASNLEDLRKQNHTTTEFMESHKGPETDIQELRRKENFKLQKEKDRRLEQIEKINRLLAKGDAHFARRAKEVTWNSERENQLKTAEDKISGATFKLAQYRWPEDINKSCIDGLVSLENWQKDLLLSIEKLHSSFKLTYHPHLKDELKKIIALLNSLNAEMTLKIIAAPGREFKEDEKTELKHSIYSLVFKRQLCILVSALSECYVAAKAIASWNIIWPLSKAKIQATPLIWRLAAVELIAVIFGASAIYLMSKKKRQAQYLDDKKITMFN